MIFAILKFVVGVTVSAVLAFVVVGASAETMAARSGEPLAISKATGDFFGVAAAIIAACVTALVWPLAL